MPKRENGSGSIVKRKRANGTKYFAYSPVSYEEDETGKVKAIRICIGSYSKKSDARSALDDWLKHPSDKINYTLADVYRDWSVSAFDDLSKQTKTNYETSWKKITDYTTPDLARTQIKLITTAELRELLNYYARSRTVDGEEKKPLSKSYISKIKALLTQLYRYAMENNIVDRNYAELVKVPKMEENKKRAFSDMEFAILEKGYTKVSGGDAVYALCYLGFRVSEFCSLTRFSYDPQNHTLTGGMKTEAGKDRVVPIHPKIRSIVAQWAQATTGTLYPSPNGKPYDKDSFRKKVWNPVIEKLGLSNDLTPHSARHTCGTMLSAGGARPEDIQRILGHEDYSVTANTYINQDLHALEEAIKKMA